MNWWVLIVIYCIPYLRKKKRCTYTYGGFEHKEANIILSILMSVLYDWIKLIVKIDYVWQRCKLKMLTILIFILLKVQYYLNKWKGK